MFYCCIVLYGILEISIELSSLSIVNATWWQRCWVHPTSNELKAPNCLQSPFQADCRATHMAATFQVMRVSTLSYFRMERNRLCYPPPKESHPFC